MAHICPSIILVQKVLTLTYTEYDWSIDVLGDTDSCTVA